MFIFEFFFLNSLLKLLICWCHITPKRTVGFKIFFIFKKIISGLGRNSGQQPKSLKYSIPLTKILPVILQKTLFFRIDPGKWLKIQKNILSNFQFIAAILIFFRFRVNHDFVTPGDTPVPVKTLFLDFRPRKTHIAPKNNSKQLLRRWCYTHFLSFARK